jgi:hypothetical protein
LLTLIFINAATKRKFDEKPHKRNPKKCNHKKAGHDIISKSKAKAKNPNLVRLG